MPHGQTVRLYFMGIFSCQGQSDVASPSVERKTVIAPMPNPYVVTEMLIIKKTRNAIENVSSDGVFKTGNVDCIRNKLELVKAPMTMDQRTCQGNGTFAA